MVTKMNEILTGIINILRIIAFVNLFGWMIIMAMMMPKQGDHPGNVDKDKVQKTLNQNKQIWRLALFVAIIPAVLAMLFPISLLLYIPGLIIGVIIKRK